MLIEKGANFFFGGCGEEEEAGLFHLKNLKSLIFNHPHKMNTKIFRNLIFFCSSRKNKRVNSGLR